MGFRVEVSPFSLCGWKFLDESGPFGVSGVGGVNPKP